MILRKSQLVRYEIMKEGVRKYAWFPTFLGNGSIIWLQEYYVTVKRHRDGFPYSTLFGIQTEKVLNLQQYKQTGIDQ